MAHLKLHDQKFGRLTAKFRLLKDGRSAWSCVCECGNTVVVLQRSLRVGATRSCGCLWRDQMIAGTQQRAGTLIGQRFKRWTVLGLTPRRTSNGGIYFLCRCECGMEREVTSDSLIRGTSRGCGVCGRRKPVCIRGHDFTVAGGRTPSGSCRLCVKSKSLKREYGITYEEFLALWRAQDGKCAVCKKDLPLGIDKQGFGRSGRIEVDHKHGAPGPVRNSVRGLLCGGRWAGCNRKLGRIDSLQWLQSVIEYLSNPPARAVLSPEQTSAA